MPAHDRTANHDMKRFLLPLILIAAAAISAAAESRPDALKLYLAGKYDAARKVCIDELAANPKNIDSYVVLSWSLIALQRWADAENYALKGYAIYRDPRLAECLGESAFYLGRNKTALRDFQNYVNAIPEGARVANAYYFMGEIYVRMARYEHADIAFSTALHYIPDNARWWTRLGWAREENGNRRGARDAYREALRLNPNLQDASDGLSRLSSSSR